MRDHIYRSYENLGVAICLNCTKFKHDIEAAEHYIFEHGYCDPLYCPRCKAEVCIPLAFEPIKPVREKYLSLDLEEWQ
jgi:hypothetical protein